MKTPKMPAAKPLAGSTGSADEMLDWIALFATRISTVTPCGMRGEKVEIEAMNDDLTILVTRRADSLQHALRACVAAGMRRFKLPNKEMSDR